MTEYLIAGIETKAYDYPEALVRVNKVFLNCIRESIEELVNPDSTIPLDSLKAVFESAIKGWQDTKHLINLLSSEAR